MREEKGYQCPSCGKATTHVVQTSSLSSCIIRIRRCNLCGYSHETVEVQMDISSSIRKAANILQQAKVAGA